MVCKHRLSTIARVCISRTEYTGSSFLLIYCRSVFTLNSKSLSVYMGAIYIRYCQLLPPCKRIPLYNIIALFTAGIVIRYSPSSLPPCHHRPRRLSNLLRYLIRYPCVYNNIPFFAHCMPHHATLVYYYYYYYYT